MTSMASKPANFFRVGAKRASNKAIMVGWITHVDKFEQG